MIIQSSKYSVVIIDDEKDIRMTLKQKLEVSSRWDIQGEAESVSEALTVINKVKPEAIFLDIKLREGDAFMILSVLRESLKEMPLIILNTGYTEFDIAQKIINEYSDYEIILLKKPFWEYWNEKETEILNKLNSIQEINDTISYTKNKLVLRVSNRTHFLKLESILFVEVESKNSARVKICTFDDVIIVNKTLIKISQILPDNFVQINRQALVNKSYIKSFDHEDHVLILEHIDDRQFDVGMVYRKNILT